MGVCANGPLSFTEVQITSYWRVSGRVGSISRWRPCGLGVGLFQEAMMRDVLCGGPGVRRCFEDVPVFR
jgi:hypothetical protein